MAAALPAGKLAETWSSLLAQFGSLKKHGRVRSEKWQGYDVVFVTCEFENYSIDAKFVVDRDGKVAGLWFLPAEEPAEYSPPPYADRESFEEREVIVGKGKWKLPGTLTLPVSSGASPALVMLHGSGPQDRDETIGPNKPFCDLAWGLASKGIAVLRYEKRTMAHGEQMASIKDRVTVNEETISDALAAMELLRNTPEVNRERIFVLGHSLGGMLIPRIALREPHIAGYILLAAPSRPMEDGILEQMTYLYGLDDDLSKDEQELLARLTVQVARVKEPGLSLDTPASDLPLGVPAAYWLDLRGYDPVGAALEVESPMLVLQGERDYQVTMKDFAGWQRACSTRNNMSCKSYPTLNHLFMKGEGKSAPDEYQRPGHVAEDVIRDIADWIAAR
jgi:dienelactone hydrolase